MKKNLGVPTRGTCPHCLKDIQLIYPGGQSLGSLVIGPHHGPMTKELAVSGKSTDCPGVGHLPVEEKKTAAQK